MHNSRQLPAWMRSVVNKNSCGPDGEKVNTEVQTLNIPTLQFPGNIVYCYRKDECNFLCEEINESAGNQVYGFDIEWKVTYRLGDCRRTATLQLCGGEEKCYIFHLSCMNELPSQLEKLLRSSTIAKVGVGIQGDADKLHVDYDVIMSNVVDLSVFSNDVLNISERWSLNGLLMNQCQLKLTKDNSVRLSDWEKYPLSESQLKYAALDAYAGYLIYKKILLKRRELVA